MNILWAQARFPAPEFENHVLPEMNLESSLHDTMLLRVAVLVLFLAVTDLCFHRFRSRKLMLLLAAAGLAIFGYIFTACPCPVGMFQNIAECVMLPAAAPVGLVLLFAVPLAAALFRGRLFCAGACPLGAVQEILHWKTVQVPRALDRVLRMLPVLLLLIVTVMAASDMGFVLCRYDPYLPLFLLSFPMPFTLVTAAFLATGFFVARPFCRYFCPYGALLRFFALFAKTKPRITTRPCINCKLCEQGCPNGAILAPEPAPTPEVQRHGARRLSLLVALTPLVLFLGGFLGYAAAPAVASFHRDVRLSRELQAGAETFETEAFDSSDTPRAVLEERIARVSNRLTIGLCLAGIVFAGCVMAEMIAEARRRKEETEYGIDASLCFCCGRCYQTCPPEVSKGGAR